MVNLPITPSPEQIDPSTLTYLSLVDRVSVSSFSEGILAHLGNGHLAVYITSDPTAEEQVLLFRFFDFFDEEKATIVLVSSSKAWLQDDRTLIFPRAESGLWRIDCSDSDDTAFSEMQDVLTYFIKYENRHHMRNTLATVNPVSGKLTNVVAKDVHLDRENEENIMDEEDFMSYLDNQKGHKLPVYMDQVPAKESSDPDVVRKVRLLYNSGNALVTGSDWIAQALVFAGNSLAKGITSGTRAIGNKIEPNEAPVKLSDEEKRIIEAVYSTTATVTHITSGLVDKAVSVAVSGINSMVYDTRSMETREPVENASRHLGVSALQAAARIVGGAATAASSILASSRDSVVEIVNKKYGSDAGYIAERALGSAANVADTLVYFDGAGISRKVIMSGGSKYSSNDSQTTTSYASEKDREIVFENNWPDEANASVNMSIREDELDNISQSEYRVQDDLLKEDEETPVLDVTAQNMIIENAADIENTVTEVTETESSKEVAVPDVTETESLKEVSVPDVAVKEDIQKIAVPDVAEKEETVKQEPTVSTNEKVVEVLNTATSNEEQSKINEST